MQDIYIIDGARTPVGVLQGSLSDVSAIDLGVIAAKGALQRFAEVLTDKRKWREETKTQRGRAVERSGRALQRRDGT
jgi:acetyl-CoA acetyltransferase